MYKITSNKKNLQFTSDTVGTIAGITVEGVDPKESFRTVLPILRRFEPSFDADLRKFEFSDFTASQIKDLIFSAVKNPYITEPSSQVITNIALSLNVIKLLEIACSGAFTFTNEG